METIYVYAKDWTALGFTELQSDQISGNDWWVVNAPRPLDATWKGRDGWIVGVSAAGRYLNGVLYAAGDPGGRTIVYPTLKDSWKANGAERVILVDAGKVEELVREYAGEYFEQCIDLYLDKDVRAFPTANSREEAILKIARDQRLVFV